MKKVSVCKVAGLLIAQAIVVLGSVKGVNAATVREADVTTPSSGNVIVGIEGTYYTEEVQKILTLINGYRKEACDQGVKDPATGKAFTSSDYKPIEWSNSLEGVAQMRAAEAAVWQDHTRPNGKSSKTCYSSKLSFNGYEVLAWNGYKSSNAILNGIKQWYGEKNAYVNNTGGVTGHYTSMIRSDVKYIGIGCFDAKNDTSSWVCVAGKISSSSPTADTDVVSQGSYEQMMEVASGNILSLNTDSDTVRIGKNATKEIPVYASIKYVEGSSFNNTTSKAKVYSGATWSSSEPSVATVSENGVVTGKAEGTTTITATVGNKSVEIKLTVAVPQSASAEDITVKAFQKPTLPEKVTVTWSDGQKSQENVEWEEIDAKSYSNHKGNKFTVTGKLPDFKEKVSVVINIIQNADTYTFTPLTAVNMQVGTTPTLPTIGTIVWSNKDEENVDVTWENNWASKYSDKLSSKAACDVTVFGSYKDPITNGAKSVSIIIHVPASDNKKGNGESEKTAIVSGEVVNDTSTGIKCEVNISGNTVTMTYVGQEQEQTSVTIPQTITVGGTSYKITSIADNAFKNQKSLKKVIIGKNIESVGINAFRGCKNLKKVTIKSTKLSKKSFGKNSFKGINKKAVIVVPKKMYKKYKKWLKAAGLPASVKIKK